MSPLHVIPADISVSGVAAMRLPASQLWAVCDPCHARLVAAAAKSARRIAAGAAKSGEGLF